MSLPQLPHFATIATVDKMDDTDTDTFPYAVNRSDGTTNQLSPDSRQADDAVVQKDGSAYGQNMDMRVGDFRGSTPVDPVVESEKGHPGRPPEDRAARQFGTRSGVCLNDMLDMTSVSRVPLLVTAEGQESSSIIFDRKYGCNLSGEILPYVSQSGEMKPATRGGLQT